MLWTDYKSISSFVLLKLFIIECSATSKRHLCVDFEMDNKRSQHGVISDYFGLHRRQCMMKCAADATCMAFNFRSRDGFCELLLGLSECYEPDDDDDFIFTQLKLPDFKSPLAKQSKPSILVTCNGFIQQRIPLHLTFKWTMTVMWRWVSTKACTCLHSGEPLEKW